MTEKESKLKPINEFFLSPIDVLLINKKMDNKYKLVELKELPIKKIVKKKRKKLRKIKIPKKENFLEKIQLLFNKINKLNIQQIKGILDVIDVQKEGVELNGFYELDISKLDMDSFKKLKLYVENCKHRQKITRKQTKQL